MKLWKVGLVLALLYAVLTVPLFASGAKEAASTDTIHIALTAPITGDYAEYGKNFQRSVEMAINEINAAGGVLGKKFELSVGDSKGDPKESANLAQKWVSDPTIVAEIGDFTSTCCMASQPIYDRAGMVQLSPTASHTKFAPGSPWSFSIVGTQAYEQPFMAKLASKTLGFKNMAVLYINNDWGVDTQKFYKENFEQQGGKIVGEESFFQGDKDFKAALTKLKASNPDALYMAAMYNDGALIEKQRQELGWNIPVLGPSSLYSDQLIKLGGAAVDGLYTNVSFFAKDPDPKIQNYVKGFEKLYNVTPNFHAALAYDAMYLLADAIKRAGSTDHKAIRDALAVTKDFSGLTGDITFTQYGDAIKSYKAVRVTNGDFQIFNSK
ncbi:MAG TPA: ABC transporter substrate-binding protein [Spirochaetia bacterium]|nr:ABC transporter substrate-binding protein [Spirochaetia bacterium]